MEIFIHPETNNRKTILLRVDRALPQLSPHSPPPNKQRISHSQNTRSIGKIIIDIQEGLDSQYNFDLTLLKRDGVPRNELNFSFAEIDRRDAELEPNLGISGPDSGVSTNLNRKRASIRANWDRICGGELPEDGSRFADRGKGKRVFNSQILDFSRNIGTRLDEKNRRNLIKEEFKLRAKGKFLRGGDFLRSHFKRTC